MNDFCLAVTKPEGGVAIYDSNTFPIVPKESLCVSHGEDVYSVKEYSHECIKSQPFFRDSEAIEDV